MMKEGMREKEEVPKEDSEREQGCGRDRGEWVTSKAARVSGWTCKGTQAGGRSEGGAERQEGKEAENHQPFIFLFCQSRLVSPTRWPCKH